MQLLANRSTGKRLARCCALFVTLAVSGLAQAATAICTAHSPAHRVALVELYSSEGCDDCPPADHWLSQWKAGGQSTGIVPLALHVDYWDGLGWKDRFANHAFTERQQRLANIASSPTVYTPEVFVSGKELRSWSDAASFASRVEAVDAEPAPADIELSLAPAQTSAPGNYDLDARFQSRVKEVGPLNAYVAVYENGLTSHVLAGENGGATLHHERVVRQWIGPVSLAGGAAHIRQVVAIGTPGAALPANQYGVAAFVESGNTGEVLQAADLTSCQ
ncbi:DUF1223 domain-containing protein [Trinickia violacea]|uniref:DUF1223 domain-containing protein n=1 Tax=Trinickia violacea TaxID=2571746 RepID=A0A4P8IVB7_9BURK|nr:DUF1223 domain-containing protein [Trinickia violacea]QCP52157.1 DUF1223 domain-containing protein [Trinickia violacea]